MNIKQEQDLVRKAQKDPAAFEALYDQYYLPIFYFIAKRTENHDLAGEVTSMTFLKAMENIKKYRFQGLPFSAWLYRIANNTLLDMYRRSKTRRVVDLSTEHLESIVEETEGGLEERETQLQELLAFIPSLQEEEITLLELRFFEERPFREVADILDISIENARVKIHRLIGKIRKKLNKKNKS